MRHLRNWAKSRPHMVPCVVAAGLSLLAVADLPYGYYMFLRWAVCAVSVYVVVLGLQTGRIWAAWLYGALAVLFNPIFRIHLSKDIWQPINVITSILLVLAVIVIGQPNSTSDIGSGRMRAG